MCLTFEKLFRFTNMEAMLLPSLSKSHCCREQRVSFDLYPTEDSPQSPRTKSFSKPSKMNWIQVLVDMRSLPLSWLLGLLVPPQNKDQALLCWVVIFWSNPELASHNKCYPYIIVQIQESESSSSESLSSLQKTIERPNLRQFGISVTQVMFCCMEVVLQMLWTCIRSTQVKFRLWSW